MAIFMGLDIATKTGYSILEDGVLKSYNSININPEMNLPQRLAFLSTEITRLLDNHKPDYCCIEEVIMAMSGPKVMRYLSRLNGVAIQTCYSILKDSVMLYEPSHWKKNSFPDLNGSSPKWQIQLACIKYFNISVQTLSIEEVVNYVSTTEKSIEDKKEEIRNFKKLLKKQPEISTSIDQKKSEIKLQEKQFDLKMKQISLDIVSQTGMTEDICDSCGIALCGYKETVSK